MKTYTLAEIRNGTGFAPDVRFIEATPERSEPLAPNIYRDAFMAQGACNLGGLVHGFARAMTVLQAQARKDGHGTDWINSHPVCVLFAEQVYHLTGSSSRYSQAYSECAEKK